MARIAILHGTLTHLIAQSAGARAVGLDVRQAAADKDSFRQGLATHRIDALVLGLDRLGSDPLREIDRLQRYTRPRVTVVTHSFTDAATRRALEARDDLEVLREPVTRSRLQTRLARLLDEPELANVGPGNEDHHRDDAESPLEELLQRPAPRRRYDEVQLNRLFEEAIEHGYEFTQHVAELLIQLEGFEAYCRRRNAGREQERGLHTDVQHGAAHARAVLEACLERLAAATGMAPEEAAQDDRDAAETGRPRVSAGR